MLKSSRTNRIDTFVPATPSRGALPRYAFAVIATLIATAVQLTIRSRSTPELETLVPVIAVSLSAWLGGFGPGILATALGALANHHFNDSSFLADPVLRRLTLDGVIISAMGGALAIARARARLANTARVLLEKQMVEIGDSERRRFGHDLHDGLGQQLTGIALLTESLAHELNRQHLPSAERAEKISGLVSETIGWTRELARGLSPLSLESDGLAAALEELAARASRLFDTCCRYDCELETLPVEAGSAVHVYRIIQEAISNSVKHGKAKNVQIRAKINHDSINLIVSDDGSGLSAKTISHPGLGLQIMQYRANLIGARLSVMRASPEGGTIVSCTLPIALGNTARSSFQE